MNKVRWLRWGCLENRTMLIIKESYNFQYAFIFPFFYGFNEESVQGLQQEKNLGFYF